MLLDLMEAFKAKHEEFGWAETVGKHSRAVCRGEILDVFPYPKERWLHLYDDANSGGNPAGVPINSSSDRSIRLRR